jgi:hypothetical protein
LCILGRSILPEDEYHKLADETIHDLLEKLEVTDPICQSHPFFAPNRSFTKNISLKSTSLANLSFGTLLRNMVTLFRWMALT